MPIQINILIAFYKTIQSGNVMYSKKVMEHFKKPHNLGKIENADGIGKVGNIVCGDKMFLYIKIAKKSGKEVISNVKFETYGCAAAIATSSIITDLAKGKTIKEALKITKNDIVNELEGLPPIKLHCSVLAIDALQEAIYDYLTKAKKTIPPSLQKEHERILKEYENVCHGHDGN
jgi:nitrogen fixation NifU-like protein